MAKKQRPPDSLPSKAYLVSFGDTMTALLAFFIVINSLSQEQTGANLYSGTGSFVNAVKATGFAGPSPTNRSKYVTQKAAPMPLYALAENLDKNPNQSGSVGPDDESDIGRKIDRDKENFQRFLSEIERQYGLQPKAPTLNDVAFDSFESFNSSDNEILSTHAIELAAEVLPVLRDGKKRLEVIIWSPVPSPTVIGKMLRKTELIKAEVNSKFSINMNVQNRIRYTVKPWLFSDAKRPIISFVVANSS